MPAPLTALQQQQLDKSVEGMSLCAYSLAIGCGFERARAPHVALGEADFRHWPLPDSIKTTAENENDLHLGRMSTALALPMPFAVFISLQRGITS